MKKILIIAVILVGIIYLPIVIINVMINCADDHPSLPKFFYSHNVESSKNAGIFYYEYDPTSVQYKSICFIAEAFVQHSLETRYGIDSLKLRKDMSYLMLKFTDERDMREIGYGKDWVINEEWNSIPTNAYYTFKEYVNDELPKDTLIFFIREKHTAIDSLDCSIKTVPMVTWDTVQSFQLIRKKDNP